MADARSREVFRFADGVVVQVIDGEALVLQLETESVYALDATGARVAVLIQQGLATADIVKTLAREFDADEAAIARDLQALVEALESSRLIVRRPAPHTATHD